MRRGAMLATLVATAIVATLAATIPGAFAGASSESAGKSTWTSVIPSGKSVSGVWGGGCVAVTAGDACSAVVTIWPNAPEDIEAQDIGIEGGLVENPFCAGELSKPVSAAGNVCMYVNEADANNVSKNGEGAWSVQAFPIDNGRRGFLVVWNALAPGASQIDGTWGFRAK